jgi:hypothetical protein
MAADNEVVQGLYNGSWASLHDFDFPYQVQNKLFQKYGRGQFAIDIMRRMGFEFNFAGTPHYAHEEGKMYSTLTTFGASTGGATAGAEVTFELAEDSVDSNGNTFARVGFTVLHKHTDKKVYELLIKSIEASSGSVSGSTFDTKTITAKPLDSSLAVGVGGIEDGTVLTVGASAKAEDTDSVTGTTKGVFRRAFYDRISRENKTLTGYQLGRERWTDKLIGGTRYLWSDVYAHEDFLMDAQIELGSFIGQRNTNSVTETDNEGNAAPVKSADGYWKWMDGYAGKITYGTGDFDFYTFDEVPEYLRSQHVISNMAWLAVGPKLYKKMENAGYEFVQQVSGGTDFTKLVSAGFKGDEQRLLGTNFSVFHKNGIMFYVTVLDSFGNPDMLGNDDLDFQESGFIIPMGNGIVDPKTGKSLPNVGLGYNIYGDVNRKRVIAPLDGMTGRKGARVVSSKDRTSIEMLSHYMPFMMGVNQTMQLLPFESYT